MIKFYNLNESAPYKLFKEKYKEALNAGQKNIEAISIASYNSKISEVDSRFVNLKLIDNKKFIFFSNYLSPKSIAFDSHNQVSGLFYWSSTNVQIRLKAKIGKTSKEYNKKYFKKRSFEKNALAISSVQSQKINSYQDILKKYNHVRENADLSKCPDNWGGYYFVPYYFEFWKGHESRVNKRDVYEHIDGNWKNYIIQP